MIDLHCHILPGVDDGAKSWDEALEMARIAEADGIKTIVSTPHFFSEGGFKTGRQLQEVHQAFQTELKKANINIEVVLGNEAYITPDLVKKVIDQEVFTIHNSRYLLIEFPFQGIPLYTAEVLYELRLRGITPIIAHPERYIQVQEDPMVLYSFIQQGALAQLNGGSLLGKYGPKAQKLSEILLKHKMVHFLGSDGHSIGGRKPELRRAFEIAANLIGKSEAEKIVYHNSKRILADQGLAIDEPIEIVKSRNKGLFGRLENILFKKSHENIKIQI